jgi:chemotaxis protein histidine kinase CheA
VGLRVSFLDDRDYRRNPEFVAQVRDALATCFPAQVSPEGGGLLDGQGYTQIKPRDACKLAQTQREKAAKAEADARQKLAERRQARDEARTTVEEKRTRLSALSTELNQHAADEKRLSEIVKADPAAQAALDSHIKQAAAAQVETTEEIARVEQSLTEAQQELSEKEKQLETLVEEQDAAQRSVRSAQTEIRQLNGDGAFLDTLQKLDEKYLSEGSRLEFAASGISADDGAAANSAEWRQSRFWLTYEYGFGALSLAFAADATYDHVSASGTAGRFGSRLDFHNRAVSAHMAAGVLVRNEAEEGFEFSSAFDIKLGTLGVLRTGLQGVTRLDDGATDLIALVAVTTASGEDVFTKVASGRVP